MTLQSGKCGSNDIHIQRWLLHFCKVWENMWEQVVRYKAVTVAHTRDNNKIMVVITLALETQPCEGL